MLDWIPVIGPALKKITSRITDKVIPDRVGRAERKRHELELDILERQTRLAEAQSPSIITSGWRPGYMWLVLAVLAYNHFMYEFILMWQNGAFHRIILPPEVWQLLSVVAGVYGVGRSVEKMGAVRHKAQLIHRHLKEGGIQVDQSAGKTSRITSNGSMTRYSCECGHSWSPTTPGTKEPCSKCGVWFEPL